MLSFVSMLTYRALGLLTSLDDLPSPRCAELASKRQAALIEREAQCLQPHKSTIEDATSQVRIQSHTTLRGGQRE